MAKKEAKPGVTSSKQQAKKPVKKRIVPTRQVPPSQGSVQQPTPMNMNVQHIMTDMTFGTFPNPSVHTSNDNIAVCVPTTTRRVVSPTVTGSETLLCQEASSFDWNAPLASSLHNDRSLTFPPLGPSSESDGEELLSQDGSPQSSVVSTADISDDDIRNMWLLD